MTTPAPLPTENYPSLGLGVITYNSRHHIDRCLESILAATAGLPSVSIVVVDNASSDGTTAHVEETWGARGVRVIARDDNSGYASGVNTVARNVEGEVLAFLNPDLVLEHEALIVGLAYLRDHREVGLVGGQLFDAQGNPGLVYGALPSPWRIYHQWSGLRRFWVNPSWDMGRIGLPVGVAGPFEVGYPCGALWLVRRAAWEEIGPFDERFFLYFEETDWATRCHRTSWKVQVHPDIRAYHEGGGSSPKGLEGQIVTFTRFFRSAFQYLAKHYGVAAARQAFTTLRATLRMRQTLHIASRSSLQVSLPALEANASFVLGPELSADQSPVLKDPSPAESPA